MRFELALATIGADCQPPLPAAEAECTWKDIPLMLEVPVDWQKSAELRKRRCERGYVDAAALIATDGTSWYAQFTSFDYNEHTRAFATALRDAGTSAVAQSYCGGG